MSSWAPPRGARWADLVEKTSERPRQLFRVYALAGVALAAILVAAFIAMSAFDIGSLGSQPVVSQTNAGR